MINPIPSPEPDKFMLPAKIYDKLKLSALVIIPAFSSLYFGLGQVWGLPGVKQVIGTLAVLTTVLGFVLGRASRNYQGVIGNGVISVHPTVDGPPALSLDLDQLPENIESMKALHLKVVPPK